MDAKLNNRMVTPHSLRVVNASARRAGHQPMCNPKPLYRAVQLFDKFSIARGLP